MATTLENIKVRLIFFLFKLWYFKSFLSAIQNNWGCKAPKHVVSYGRTEQMLWSHAYTLLALTVWTSEIWEDFWMMRLVGAGPAAQLCLGGTVGPSANVPSVTVVLATEKGPRVQPIWSALRLCPWARLVRATAAWISLQPWSLPLCCCCSLGIMWKITKGLKSAREQFLENPNQDLWICFSWDTARMMWMN